MTIGSFNSVGSRVRGNTESAAEVPLFNTFTTMAKYHEPTSGLDLGANNNLTGEKIMGNTPT